MDKKLISEELKRYKQLLEYTFYVEDKEEKKDDNGELLLDILKEQDPVPGDESGEVNPFAAEPTDTSGEEVNPFAAEPTDNADTGEVDPFATEPKDTSGEEVDPFATSDETPMPIEDEMADEGDTVEVDVTDLVDKTEETKSSVDGLTSKMEELLNKLNDLESQVGGMDNVINKIDDLEKEIEKRNPTPVEKLEMRSLSSYPYTIKLTDFWQDKEGYEAQEPEEEFTLTQDDIDNFDKEEIKRSFDFNKDMDSDY